MATDQNSHRRSGARYRPDQALYYAIVGENG